VFVYVIVYNYVNVCTRHNNKPFTYLLTYTSINTQQYNATRRMDHEVLLYSCRHYPAVTSIGNLFHT